MGERADVGQREVVSREVDEGGEGLYVDMRNDGDGFRKEGIVEEEKVGVRIGAKLLVCGDEVRKEDVSAITNETWLTGGSGGLGTKKGHG